MFQSNNVEEITPGTMAVLSVPGSGNSRILEGKDELLVECNPSKLIDYACRFFGSSLKGRQEGTAHVCRLTHKAPIAVNPSNGMYFFPTSSPSNSDCSWIAHSHIHRIERGLSGTTRIIFKNEVEIAIPVSHGIIVNQIQRTAQFRYLLERRLGENRPQSFPGLTADPFA